MLNNLYRQNNNDYVTQKDLADLIKQLTKIEKLRGEPGKDAEISPVLVKQILELATPIRGVHYRDGKPGKDGKTIIKEKEISGEEMIERISQAETKLRIPFSALEDGHVLLDNINDVIQQQNDLSQFASNYYDEYVELRDKIHAIDIQIQRPHTEEGGGALPDGFLQGVNIDCNTGIISFDVDGTILNLDASCLQTKSVCETFDPTTEGIAEGFSNGSQWYNTTDNKLYTFMCGQWLPIALAECNFVYEQGGNITTESGDNLLPEQECNPACTCACDCDDEPDPEPTEDEYVTESGDNIHTESDDELDTESM